MKLIVCDYDGTIKPNSNLILDKITFQKNILSINKFIEKNNIFIISTKRNTKSIKNEILKNKIKYSYLITYNGRVILDNNGVVIFGNCIEDEIINIIKNNIVHSNVEIYDIYGEVSKNNENVVLMELELNNYKDNKKAILELQEKYNDLNIHYSISLNKLIIRKKFNKALGIKKLFELENIIIDKENIITIGNDVNDIEMLKDYNGYRMVNSSSQLSIIDNTISSVYKLIKKIK